MAIGHLPRRPGAYPGMALPDAFDFTGYLKEIGQDARYQAGRDLYTETEALITLEAETVAQKSPGEENRGESASSQPKVDRFPVLAGLRQYALGDQREHVLLAGRPGSGKSTTLKQLLLELAGLDQPEYIPVYVQLKSDRPITDLIIAEFRRAKVRVTPEQLDDWLLQDQLLLLLDGVNEIPSEVQRRKLQEFREDNPNTPMIFTTRDLSVGGDLRIEKRLEMRPLSESQMWDFVQKYLGQRGLSDQTNTLLKQLKDRLREIAETPLLLKMLCDVFDPAMRQIPQSKGELFRQFDAKYEEFKGLPPVSADFRRFKPELLRHLAFCMMQGDSAKPAEAWLTLERSRAEKILEDWLTGRVEAPGQRAKEWLEDLLEHHLLQVATDPREIEFHHQLFQEYHAAEELRLQLPELLKDENKFKRDYLNLLKWTEPIALMLALLDEEDQALRVVELAMDVDLMLGARLAGKVQSESQNKTVKLISDSDITALFKIKLLGITQSNAALALLNGYLANLNSDTRSDVVNAMGEIGNHEAEKYLLKVFSEEKDFIVYDLVAYHLGKIGSLTVIDTLLKALNCPDSCSRLGIISALGEINDEAVVDALCNILRTSISNEIRLYTSFSLNKLRGQACIPPSCQNLIDKALPKRVESHNTNSQHEADLAKKQIIRIIRQKGKDSILKELINGRSTGFHLMDLAYQLLKFHEDEMLSIFLQELVSKNNKFSTRYAIAHALSRIGMQDSIPTLMQGLMSRKAFFYTTSSIALKRMAPSEYISQVYNFLRIETCKPLHLRHLVDVISAIQNRCQFYSYEIWQQSTQNAKSESQKTENTAKTGQMTNIFNIETFQANNSAINLGGTVHGDQIGKQDLQSET